MKVMPSKAQASAWRKKAAAPTPVPPPAPARPSLRPHMWRVLGLWAVALAAYANSFRAGMTLDNATIILKDARIQAATLANLRLIFSQEYWYGNATTNLYRPLTTISYLVNFAILGNGPHPAGYHWGNFAIHAVNILLVYSLGLLILRRPWLSMALAAVWSVHPVLTESVTNIVGRADELAAFGVLAALLCHVRGAAARGPRKAAWLAATAVAAAIGIFSKESGVVVLAVLPLYDFAFGGVAAVRARIAGYAALLPAVAAFLYFRGAMLAAGPTGVVPFVDNPLQGADFWTSRLTAVKALGKLFALFLWPAALSCDYSYNQVPLFSWGLSWESAQALLALAGCAAAAALAIRWRRAGTPLFFVGFWFVTIAPTANFAVLIGTIMAERFLYLPSVALAAGVVLALDALARRFAPSPAAARRITAIAVGVICLACAARTFARNADWHDEISLWTSAVHVAPAAFRTHVSLALALSNAGTDLDRAVHEADLGLDILGTLPDDRGNRVGYLLAGICYRTKGDSLRAGGRPWYEKARDTLLHGIRIDILEQAHGRAVNLALHKGPFFGGQTGLYMELGRVYQRLSDPRAALGVLADGRAIDPQPEFSAEMSGAYRQLGDADGSAISLMEGLVMKPEAAALAGPLVAVYRDLYQRFRNRISSVAKTSDLIVVSFRMGRGRDPTHIRIAFLVLCFGAFLV